MISIEDLSLLEGLWDDDDDNNDNGANPTLLESPPAEAAAASSSSSSRRRLLEEKLLSLEIGNDRIVPTDVVGDVQSADYSELDEILAKDMSQLSMKERDYVLQDIHGVAEVQDDETPEFVKERLQQLDDQVDKISKKEAYDQALYLSPEYVQNPKFRLMFLRGELYDAEKAAIRLVRHFEEKLKLFGADLLAQDIRLSDLNDADRETLKKGAVQILPIRDRANRTIICLLPLEKNPNESLEQIYSHRCSWYMSMAVLEDEDTQKNGVVGLFLNSGKNRVSFEEISYVWEEIKLSVAYPHRMVSCHYCYDDKRLYPFITFIRFVFGSRLRGGRFLPHFGKPSEYKYELMTYGIPTRVLPMDDEYNVSLTQHLDWLERRQVQESSFFHQVAPVVPRRFDVLFGRGQTISEHTGNLRAFHIVEMNQERYEKAGKFEKTQIADRIVHLIHQSYGRFLKKEVGGLWVEVPRDVAREKISHCFRRLREVEANTSKYNKATKRHNQGTYIPPDEISTSSSTIATSNSTTTTKRAKSFSS